MILATIIASYEKSYHNLFLWETFLIDLEMQPAYNLDIECM